MDNTRRDDIDAVFRKVERCTSVGATISALEQLASSSLHADDDLLSWPVLKLHAPQWWRSAGEGRLDALFGYPNVLSLPGTRMLAGLGLLLPGTTRAQRGALAATMCGTAYGMQTQMRYGLDGSDHMAFLNFASSALEKLFPDNARAREAVVVFLAAQACLSYFTSGAAKLASPVWRDGTAIPGIFRTATYGDRFFYELVRDRPWLAKTVAWSTIAGELAFPLALVAPKPVARGLLATGTAFHLGNAKFMGLNRFVWSFCATYPAVAHVSRALGPRKEAPAKKPLNGATWRGGSVRTAPRAASLLVGAGAAAVAGAAVYRRVRSGRARAVAVPGELVTVGGRDVHVVARTGGSGPTVVFENGMACPATGWSWVWEGMEPGTRYVAYDRPGTGWSAPAKGPQDAERASAGLRELLARLGAEPPYVLVGQSVGGLLIRSFARRHPELVGGLVFVDASHPDQLARSAGQRRTLPWLRQRMTSTWLRAELGMLPEPQRLGPFSSLPAPLAAQTVERMKAPASWRAARREMSQWPRSWSADAAKLTDAGGRPVAVLTASGTVERDPVHADLQAELAALSHESRHDLVPGATHESLVMDPQHAPHVADAIAWTRKRAAVGEGSLR
ncbi:alpha/beta fold hydrolase [Streptomyces sulphureus]|uniref:alpha/beta fold hydrolase n=1 Tax=Streptomyces sulphureus TaxID=47758 RepID=UPI0003692752|nr:alpha/beta fold hydrolase [Streptomyces sulphureus]